MLRKRENFTSDLKLINDEFGEVVAKSGVIFIQLFTKHPQQHTKLTKFLSTKNLEFFVLTPKWLRPITVVIKELPWEAKPHEIKAFLEEFHKLTIEKVVKHTSLRTKRPLQLFQVTLPNSENNSRIWNVEYILYMKVQIQKFKRRTGTLMCFNCNLFRHSAESCIIKARCLKCGGEHADQQYDKTFDPKDQGKIANPKYINCGKERLLASWRGCEKFKPKAKTNPKTNFLQSRPVDTSITYAAMASYSISLPDSEQNLNSIKENTPVINLHREKINILNDIFYILNEFKKLFGNTDVEILAQQLKKANNDIDKTQIFISRLNYN
ncbi:hypothetical protein AVEN_62462-1 [Araneus ventricosus]|uniref:Pre-C2HC domain-containing protein n=1 Tax=Araneus ventricosus TaxID=182803 RepID=A0A4Y2NME2_ARAVE|nr:hypothetical protein AVEN_62462-1 [Araneus ventricosus]